jgi:hypothetical protein
MTTDLEDEIGRIIADSYEQWGDHEADEAIARFHKERAEQLRNLDQSDSVTGNE